MDWQVMFAAGVAGGLAIWPVSRGLARIAPATRALRRAIDGLRFWLAFGFRAGSDPDLQELLRPAVEQHIAYLRQQVLRGRKEVLVARSAQPHSLMDARRAMAALRRAKARLASDEERLAAALRVAAACGFSVMPIAPAIADGPRDDQADVVLEPQAPQTAVAQPTASGEGPAAVG